MLLNVTSSAEKLAIDCSDVFASYLILQFFILLFVMLLGMVIGAIVVYVFRNNVSLAKP